MIAARAYEGERELRLEQIDRPQAGPGEVVIKVEAAGLPAGVITQWLRGAYPIMPRTLGNEAAGTIAELGPGVSEVRVGDRVRLHPQLSCRSCEYCLTDREQMCPYCSLIGQGIFGKHAMPMYERYHNGGLAEFVLAPAWAVDPLPDAISFDVAAKVHDIADALRVWKTAAPKPGATVVFTAATGTVGVAAIRMARLFGVGRLIAVARARERLAAVQALDSGLVATVAFEDLDADWADNGGLTRAIRAEAPDGVDAVIDFLPQGAGTWQSITSMKMGGTAVIMGANPAPPPIPTVALMHNCWRIIGTRSCTRADALQVMEWLTGGSLLVEDLITHRFRLSDVASAVRIVRDRPEPSWLVVVNP